MIGVRMKSEHSWHEIPEQQVLSDLEATPEGLSEDEAVARLNSYGRNRLPRAVRRSVLLRFIAHFNNAIIYGNYSPHKKSIKSLTAF